MKRILVTPAGRKEYLEILSSYLIKYNDEFDVWRLWVNTNIKEDIDYMVNLEKEYDFIELEYLDVPYESKKTTINWVTRNKEYDNIFNVYFDKNNITYNFYTPTIGHFFKNCIDENSVYIRLDDDIVYIEKNSLKKLFDYRIEHEEFFLVYGNIINNPVISYIHQQKNIIRLNKTLTKSFICPYGWLDQEIVYSIHKQFINNVINNDIDKYKFGDYILSDFSRVQINAISWLGKEFKLFGGVVGDYEEQWLTEIKPVEINKPNMIFGDSIFAHFAFAQQHEYFLNHNLLYDYKKILLNNL